MWRSKKRHGIEPAFVHQAFDAFAELQCTNLEQPFAAVLVMLVGGHVDSF